MVISRLVSNGTQFIMPYFYSGFIDPTFLILFIFYSSYPSCICIVFIVPCVIFRTFYGCLITPAFLLLNFLIIIFWVSRGKSAVVNIDVEREFGISVSVAKRHVHCRRGQVAMKVEGC